MFKILKKNNRIFVVICDYILKNENFIKQLNVIVFINIIVVGYLIFLKEYHPAIIYTITVLIGVSMLFSGLRRIKYYKNLKDLSEIETKYYYYEVHGVIICYFIVVVVPLILILIFALKISFSDTSDNNLGIQ